MLGVGDVIAIATLAFQISTLCKEYVSEVRHAPREVQDYVDRLERLSAIASSLQTLIERNPASLTTSQQFIASLDTCRTSLDNVHQKLTQKIPLGSTSSFRGSRWKSLKWPFSKSAMSEEIVQLDKCLKDFELPLQVDQSSILLKTHAYVESNSASTIRVEDKLDQARQRETLKLLKPESAAAFNAKERMHEACCLPGTRAHLLKDIEAWAQDFSSEPIFWLSGMAGTGKSTVAQTLATSFYQQNRLAGSFFFQRGNPNLNGVDNVFTTLAFQMAQPQFPHFRELICNAIEQNETIRDRFMTEQYEILFAETLRQSSGNWSRATPLVFVLDALDECEDEKGLNLLMKKLEMTNDLSTFGIKIFMTSRPEQVINTGMLSMQDSTLLGFRLHDIDKNLVTSDISDYLLDQFASIRQRHNLDNSWPGSEVIAALAVKADGLFIYAATMCRLLHGCTRRKSVKELVVKICDQENVETMSTKQLDMMYTFVLDQCDRKQDDFIEVDGETDLRAILISIVTLFDPMTPEALSCLLYGPDEDPQDTVYEVCEHLGSVLRFSKGQTLQVLHESFRDFLKDQNRCQNPRLWIDTTCAHIYMVEICLRAMQELKQDICEVSSVGTHIQDVGVSSITKFIPSHVAYACRYWLDHAVNCALTSGLLDSIQNFLRNQGLFWLEALAWLNEVPKAVAGLRRLQNRLFDYNKSNPADQSADEARSWVSDLAKFTATFVIQVSDHPLQIYCSALCFAPFSSQIASHFKTQRPIWLRKSLTDHFREPTWDDSLSGLHYSNSPLLESILVSDSKFVILAYKDTLKLFSWSSGGFIRKILQEFTWDAQNRDFLTADLSPDGSLIAVGLPSGMIVLENVFTNHVVFRTVESTQPILHIKFDFSSQYLTVVHYSGKAYRITIAKRSFRVDAIQSETLADIGSGRRYQLPIHPSDISPDGSLLALRSLKTNVNVWNIAKLQLLRSIHFFDCGPSALKFSGDNATLLLADLLSRFRLWNRESDQLQDLAMTSSNYAMPSLPGFSISHSGKWFCYTSFDRLLVGNTITGAQIVACSSNVKSARFLCHEEVLMIVTKHSPDHGRLELFDCASGLRISPLRMAVRQAYYSAKSDTLTVMFSDSNECKVWKSEAFISAATHIESPSVIGNYFIPQKSSFVNVWSNKSIQRWTYSELANDLIKQDSVEINTEFGEPVISEPGNSMALVTYGDLSYELVMFSSGRQKILARREKSELTAAKLVPKGVFSTDGAFAYTWSEQVVVLHSKSHHGDKFEVWQGMIPQSNLCFSPDGESLIFFRGGVLNQWYYVSGKITRISLSSGANYLLSHNMFAKLRFSPDGQFVVVYNEVDMARCVVVNIKTEDIQVIIPKDSKPYASPGMNAWFNSDSNKVWMEHYTQGLNRITLYDLKSNEFATGPEFDIGASYQVHMGDWYDLKTDSFRYPIYGKLDAVLQSHKEAEPETALRVQVGQAFEQSTISLSQDHAWIYVQGHKCLYLPATRRPRSFEKQHFSVGEGFISMVSSNGLLTILRIDPGDQPWVLNSDKMMT